MSYTRKNRRMRGGAGPSAAQYVLDNYGTLPKQLFNSLSQAGPTGNSQSLGSYNILKNYQIGQTGGRRRRRRVTRRRRSSRRGRRGGSVVSALGTAMVPATLYAAAMMSYKNRSRGKRMRGGFRQNFNQSYELSPASYPN